MSQEEKKRKEPKLPDLNPDGTWDTKLNTISYRFREETIGERSRARNEALAEAPADPQFEEQARILALVVQRQKKDGTWENLTTGEILGKGPIFYGWLNNTYMAGLEKKAKELLSTDENSTTENSAAQKSELQIRP